MDKICFFDDIKKIDNFFLIFKKINRYNHKMIYYY
jgi:hypothetical protein